MNNEIEKREQQVEEIRGIITFHRSKALQGVNEESLMMSWRVGQVVSHRLKTTSGGAKSLRNYQNIFGQRILL